MDNLKLENIKDGAALELANKEIQRILDDIADVNKIGNSKRELTLKVAFVPTDDASFGVCVVSVSSTLGKRKEAKTTLYFGVEDGHGIASEKSNISQPQLYAGGTN